MPMAIHRSLPTPKPFSSACGRNFSGEFFGIGIEITMENNQLTVVTPIEDTPADKGGMKSGDIILAVGGKPTLEMTLQEAVSHIRGPKGSEVVLTILHRDSKEPVDLRIKRDAIPLISVKSRELEPGYYWVRLTRFSERTTQELLDAAMAQGYEISPRGTARADAVVENEMYRCYAEANRELDFRGGKLAESAPTHPVEVGRLVRDHWTSTYWPGHRSKAAEILVKELVASGLAKKKPPVSR